MFDLQFEYRVSKLSDHDYQQTKLDLQKELATVMAKTDRVKAEVAAGKIPAPAPELLKTAAAPKRPAKNICPWCSAEFCGAAQVLRRVRQADEGGAGMMRGLRIWVLGLGACGRLAFALVFAT